MTGKPPVLYHRNYRRQHRARPGNPRRL